MPHFCECGADKYICQVCGRDRCSREEPPEWLPIPSKSFEGNICPSCIANHGEIHKLDTLYEHCRKESGLSNPREIDAYMQRYYGHG